MFEQGESGQEIEWFREVGETFCWKNEKFKAEFIKKRPGKNVKFIWKV